MAAFHEEHKAEIQELSSQRLDALNRRRDVYARLATKMRILLRADMSPAQREQDKWSFLTAYDEGYIWASEPVAARHPRPRGKHGEKGHSRRQHERNASQRRWILTGTGGGASARRRGPSTLQAMPIGDASGLRSSGFGCRVSRRFD